MHTEARKFKLGKEMTRVGLLFYQDPSGRDRRTPIATRDLSGAVGQTRQICGDRALRAEGVTSAKALRRPRNS